jgi:general secretion pathway protein G
MISRRSTEPLVFFPWEKRRGVMGAFGRRRLRVLLGAAAFVALVVTVYENGERAASVRATRATITTVGRAIDAYRADHADACPRRLSDLGGLGYLHGDPVDAWGRPLRLVCPGRRDPLGFDLSSDGPDGLPGGLDHVE